MRNAMSSVTPPDAHARTGSLEILTFCAPLLLVSTMLDYRVENVFVCWNRLLHCDFFISEQRPPEPSTPCIPSPCGPNAVCREQNGAGSCTCLPEYFGDPYQECRPECLVNSDCPSNKACVNNKCRDPCPGTCGINADCRVISHVPSCTCLPSYTGNPFVSCSPIPSAPPGMPLI